jgi:hypothetical protein
MNKSDLNVAVDKCKSETKAALQTVYDTLNHGQQKKLIKDDSVKALFDLYGVEYTE